MVIAIADMACRWSRDSSFLTHHFGMKWRLPNLQGSNPTWISWILWALKSGSWPRPTCFHSSRALPSHWARQASRSLHLGSTATGCWEENLGTPIVERLKAVVEGKSVWGLVEWNLMENLRKLMPRCQNCRDWAYTRFAGVRKFQSKQCRAFVTRRCASTGQVRSAFWSETTTVTSWSDSAATLRHKGSSLGCLCA